MTASESSPPEGQDGDGASLEDRAALRHAKAIAESAQEGIPLVRDDPTREVLLEEVQRARADLALVEELLCEDGGVTSE